MPTENAIESVKPSVTIKDVARRAGVSIATVSRALNKPGRVSARTVAQVQASAEVLGYVPYGAARSLVSRRFNTIGAIVPTIDNAIFAKAMHALQSQLNEHGYTLLIASTDYQSAREGSELQSLIEHGIDGVVLVGATHHSRVLQLLEMKHIPFVNTWIYDASSAAPCIGFDNQAAMERLTNYLFDLGHRRFAVIAGITRDNDRAAARLSGVCDVLTARGFPLSPDRIVERPYTIADGRSAMRMLLALPEPPTAVICGNDILAFGAIYECIAQGISVPHSVSVAGFDDFELSSHIVPSLTTMRIPAVEMGTSAADYLVARLAGKTIPDHVEYEAELIVRDSTAPPSAMVN